MKIKQFKLERLFAKYKPFTKYMLSPVTCEPYSMAEILSMADDECKKLWDSVSLGYTEHAAKLLCEAITARYTTMRPRDILEVVPEEGIFIFMNAMLDQGDEVIIMQPALPSLYEIPRALGCEIIRWPLEETTWGWRLNVNFLASRISPRTKMLILNIPNNPTGYIPVRTEMERILNIVDMMGTWVFSEEMYRGMENDPAGALPSVADLYSRAVSLGGCNRYGLPGIRMGWLATRNTQVLEACEAYRDYTTLCASTPSEILATIAMRNADDLLLRNHRIILDNLKIAEEFFRKHRDLFTWIQPNGGAISFPKLIDSFDVTEMCERAIEDKGLLIIGKRAYGINANHFRVGLGRRDFPQALAVFEEIVNGMENKLNAK